MTGKSSHLCNECYLASLPPEERGTEIQLCEAQCQYCGGQPCAGGTDIFALMVGIEKMKYMCMPCSMEHNRYLQQQSQQLVSGLSHRESLAALKQLDVAADEHMKQWVLKRGLR